jgi:hypothetical protein
MRGSCACLKTVDAWLLSKVFLKKGKEAVPAPPSSMAGAWRRA